MGAPSSGGRKIRFGCLLLGLPVAVVVALLALSSWPEPFTVVLGERSFLVTDLDSREVEAASVKLYRRLPYRLEPELLAPDDEVEGDVVVMVTAPGFAGEVIPLPPGPSPYFLQLSRGAPAEGLVLDLEGRPIVGARVVSPHRPPYLVETSTDEQGRFVLPPVAQDAWVRAEAPGFAPLDIALSLYPEEDPDLVLYLVRERRVRGRVVDSKGHGVPGAIVTLDQECVTRIAADGEGRFDMGSVLTDWEVLLSASAKGMVGPTVNVLAGETEVELPLYRPAEIRGAVVDGTTGKPIPAFDVRRVEAKVGTGGTFTVSGLLPGPHRIEVVAGSRHGEAEVDVREGETRSGVVIPVRPPRWSAARDYRLAYPVEIRAFLAGGGGPAEGVLIRGLRGGEKVQTGADGIASVSLPPGRHELTVGSAIGRYAPVEVEIVSPDRERLVVEVTPNPEARIEFAGGEPENRSKLWLKSEDEVREHEFRGGPFEFHASRDRPLDVYVKARGYLPAVLEDALVPESGLLEIPLPEGAFIRGRCLGSGGHPLPKVVAEVREMPLDARMETLGDGVFRAGALPPGRYSFLLYARNVRTRRYDLTVPAKGVDLGDVAMLPPCDLKVLVVDSAGAPVSGALVETSLLVASKGSTGAGGTVTLPGTNAEESLRVNAPGYLDTWHDVVIPDEARTLPVRVVLYRPARLLLRAVDEQGAPVEVLESDGPDFHRVGPGTYVMEDLPPGALEISLSGHNGRVGHLMTVFAEGEEKVLSVVLR
jgi:hypothetical protein